MKPMNCPGHCYLFAHAASTRTATCRSATPTSAACIASSAPARSPASRASARSRRTTPTSSARPEQIDAELDALHRDDARGLRRLRLRPRRGHAADAARRSSSAGSSCGTRPRRRSRRALEQRRLRGRRCCRATARSTARRSTSTSSTCSSARGRSRRCRSTAPCPSASGSRYVTPEGTEATPVMIHRAVLGSIERFIAILIEHTGGQAAALARARCRCACCR